MNITPHIHTMIVAAGRGSRFGAAVAKQYTTLNDKTLLQHSVHRLASSTYINSCFLVIAADDQVAKNLAFELPMHYVIGGKERWQSVQAGVKAIIDNGADNSDLIVIHDAARPAVPIADIDEVISAAMLEPYGAILAAPVADTLKQSKKLSKVDSSIGSEIAPDTVTNIDSSISSFIDDTVYIDKTVDRSQMWQAQTPQVFRVGELSLLLKYVEEHQLDITDEASAFEHLKLPIRLVVGSRQNIKLTFPEDAILLSAILMTQAHSKL